MESKSQCSICEAEIDRTDLEYVELGKHLPPNYRRSFYACNSCAMKEKLNWYMIAYEQARETIERQKTENNLFRTLMMKIETMKAIGSESEVSVRSYILQHRPGWEALPLDVLMLFLDLYTKHASVFAEIINKKASKDEINAHLKERTENAKKQHKETVEKKRIEENDGLKGTYTKDEKKAILSLMKSPIGKGKTEAQIYEFIKHGMQFKVN